VKGDSINKREEYGISGDVNTLIASATLFDLLGYKALASLMFYREELSDDLMKSIVDEYYMLIQEDTARGFIVTKINGHAVNISKVSDMTVVIALSDTDAFSDEEITTLQKFQTNVALEILNTSVRDFKSHFPIMIDENLRVPLNICFVTDQDPTEDNKAAIALDALAKIRGTQKGEICNPIKIGPYKVKVMNLTYSQAIDRNWADTQPSINIFALIISESKTDKEKIRKAVMKIREESGGRTIVIPGSDADLEAARALEIQYGIDLCDSVSPKPTNLLLSAMAYSGFCDMQPELAVQKWEIEPLSSGPKESEDESEEERGHQAFFVVDRRTGEAMYSYYYDERSKLLEIAPSIVAAITSFKIDKTNPADTSVFRTGDLSYITIERNEYVFTLVTGKSADVESLRSRFSFLPDLFLDEIPAPSDDPTDLFRSPLFTLKLLATLPPFQLLGRVAPTQKRALVWERFEHPPVRDFLEAVWYRLDGSLTMSKLAPGKGSELILGAIHLLNRLGAIDCQLRVLPDDVPVLSGIPDEEILSLYEGLENILSIVDGKTNIQNMARKLNLQPSVLVTVFAELHKRGVVRLETK
jgi:hypothetical protein